MVESGPSLPPTAPSVQPPSATRWYMLAAVLLLGGAGAGAWVFSEYAGWRTAKAAPAVQPALTAPAPVLPVKAVTPAPLPPPSLPQSSGNAGDAAALAARVAALEAQLSQMSVAADSMNGSAGRAEAMLVAFAARRALDRGLALGPLEGQLRFHFGAAQPNAVANIVAAARAPVTLESLQTRFDQLAPQLAGTGRQDSDLWHGFRREIGELFVLRRADAPSLRDEQRLARTRSLLTSGRVDAALREIAELPGAAAAQNWMADARRYHDARRALDLIETAAILAPRETASLAIPPQAASRL
jgi:hypothetical protein